MKKLNIFLIILLGLIGITSCTDEIGPVINPQAEDGTLTFKLNQTKYSDWTYVLESANEAKDMDALTCVQPEYGFTAGVTYSVQVSFSPEMSDSTELPTTVNGEKVNINTKEMNKAMILLYGKLPNPIVEKDVYVRLKAFVSDATKTPLVTNPTVKALYSNVIKLKILPYELPLLPYTEVTPAPYYIVGLGDGTWNNTVDGLGKSLIPLGLSAGKKYDLNGNGEFVYTGYFQASRGFKLIKEIGGWTDQWGNQGSDGIDKPINKAIAGTEPSNFKVPTDGYYTITLNSIDNTVTIVPASVSPSSYNSIGLVGGFNSWGNDVVFAKAETTNNHVWYATYTFAADTECKFRADAAWDANWGAGTFPRGISTAGGSNIPAKAGTYVIIFNDIDGCFYFIQK